MPRVISAVDTKSEYDLGSGNTIKTSPVVGIIPQEDLTDSTISGVLSKIDLLFVVTSTEG